VVFVAWRPAMRADRTADPDRVMRGEPSTVTLTVRNTGRLRSATLVAYDRCGADTVPVPLLRLRPGRDSVTTYPVPTSRRGVVPVGPLRVVREDPLGLVRAARTHGDAIRVWVYPRVHHLTAVPVGVLRSLDGRVDRVPHGSVAFDTLRGYVIGDELRRVHWRTSARVGELMVREQLDTSLPRLVVLVDDRSVVRAAAFEAVCEAAASVVVAAVREDLPVALRLVGGGAAGEGSRRTGTATPYLDLLAEASPAAPEDALRTAVERLRHTRPGDTLVYLTGPGRPDEVAVVASLRGAYPTIVVGTVGEDPAVPALDGIVGLPAPDGAAFARAWDGVGGW